MYGDVILCLCSLISFGVLALVAGYVTELELWDILILCTQNPIPIPWECAYLCALCMLEGSSFMFAFELLLRFLVCFAFIFLAREFDKLSELHVYVFLFVSVLLCLQAAAEAVFLFFWLGGSGGGIGGEGFIDACIDMVIMIGIVIYM